ncbi:serine protease [Paracoccus sp. (in: a-proteobacteria)]|uniref:trypsin-like serine peptidase n=1 Tax=Paracoccus sp. TaxID=267 RepID=UPI0035B4BD11
MTSHHAANETSASQRTRARDLVASAARRRRDSPGRETAPEANLELSLTPDERLERSEAWMATFIEQLGDEGKSLLPVTQTLLADGRRGLERIESEGPDATLDEAAEVGLEAIIETDGTRPVLLVQDDALNSAAVAATGDWQTLLGSSQKEISQIVRAVGRVNDPSHAQRFQGTAFMVAPGILMTNRHVLQGIAAEDDGRWTLRDDITVDFAQEYKRDRMARFAIREVLFAGPDLIDVFSIDHDLLDLALLRVEAETLDRRWPLPLPITVRPEADDVPRAVVVSGFPGDPQSSVATTLKKKLFDLIFGYKILAPGRVKKGAGEIAGNGRNWSIGHDATTLPGNSGSCIIDIESGAEVMALHYAGAQEVVNFAHVLGLVGNEKAGTTGKSLLELLKAEGAVLRT